MSWCPGLFVLPVNPANTTIAETTLREVQETARAIGLQIQILNASTIDEINAAFAGLARERGVTGSRSTSIRPVTSGNWTHRDPIEERGVPCGEQPTRPRV
jgi:hypothetical protein